MSQFGNVPERWIQEGVKVHYNELARVGDRVEAIRTVQGVITKGTQLVIDGITVDANGNDRGFVATLHFQGIEGNFNPKRFRKL